MITRFFRLFDPLLNAIILLAYSSKKLPVAVALFASCTVAVGQQNWMMLDLNETSQFTTTEQYCDHLKIVFKKSVASDNKDENCPCEWARIYDMPAPTLGDGTDKVLLSLCSAADFGLSDEELDLQELNRRADSAGYEPYNLRVPLRLLELMKEDLSKLAGHVDLVVPFYTDGDLEFAHVTYGHVTRGMGEWRPGSGPKRAWIRGVMRDEQKFVYRKK